MGWRHADVKPRVLRDGGWKRMGYG
jgi:hypothetical protein